MDNPQISQVKGRILWSNRPWESLSNELLPCFPLMDSDGCGLDRLEVRFLMTELSSYYTQVLKNLAQLVASITNTNREACEVILREPVVLITYALSDRILRLGKVISHENSADLHVAVQNKVSLPKTNAHFIGQVDGSQEFNQYLIFRLASSIWQLPGVTLERQAQADARNTTKISNLNFDQPRLPTRIRRKLSRLLSGKLGRFPSLRLANIEAHLLDGGIYGNGKLLWLRDLEPSSIYERDTSLRTSIRQQLVKPVRTLLCDTLFPQLGILDANMRWRATEIYCELLLELIPPDRLEGLSRHTACEQRLKSLSPPALLFCGMPSGEDIHWIAAARKLRIPVIGVQHGSHYGFTNHPCFVDTELAYCDRFISWGWNTFPLHPLCTGIRAIALPSPWLSERVKTWKKIPVLQQGKRTIRPHDVLFMSDRIQTFPPTVSTLRMSRLDFLSRLNSATWSIVSELATRNIRVLNKPFNYTSRDMQASVLDKLTVEFPDCYREYQKLDKGLTVALIESAWVILWDEPGTGFFECLASGIPTMVYWERLTSWEEEYARPYFKQLEDVGLLHDTPSSLAEEILRFLQEPKAWLTNEERCAVIQEVINRFSKIDADWRKPWKAALKTLAN